MGTSRRLLNGDFPGAAAGGSLEQVDATRQVDNHVVVQVVNAAHHASGHVIDGSGAQVLVALDENAALLADDV